MLPLLALSVCWEIVAVLHGIIDLFENVSRGSLYPCNFQWKFCLDIHHKYGWKKCVWKHVSFPQEAVQVTNGMVWYAGRACICPVQVMDDIDGGTSGCNNHNYVYCFEMHHHRWCIIWRFLKTFSQWLVPIHLASSYLPPRFISVSWISRTIAPVSPFLFCHSRCQIQEISYSYCISMPSLSWAKLSLERDC